jgi:hypothetical protein
LTLLMFIQPEAGPDREGALFSGTRLLDKGNRAVHKLCRQIRGLLRAHKAR